MIVTNKLYRKDFNQYNEEDWKYIFSIYILRDRYNFTEEEFLAAELVDKVIMLKKMDDNLFVKGTIDIDLLHENESVFAPCLQDKGCKVIQDFLEDEDVKDINHSEGIPACSSEDTCEAVQELLDTKDEPYALYLSIKKDVYKNIQYHEDIINDLLTEIKRNLVMIDESKHRLKISYARYIKII